MIVLAEAIELEISNIFLVLTSYKSLSSSLFLNKPCVSKIIISINLDITKEAPTIFTSLEKHRAS